MSRARLLAPLAVALLAFVPACARRPAEPAPEAPAVVIAPDPVPEPLDDGSIPPPRAVPPAAEPSDASDALEVFVVRGGGGVWKAQYPSGQRVVIGAAGKLILPLNKPVKFTCITENHAAAFEVPAFPLVVEAVAGRYTSKGVLPKRAGEFEIRSGRDRIGSVVVVTATEFDDWLLGIWPRDPTADESPASAGRTLFLKLQCVRCHSATPNGKAPVLEGLYGTRVALKGGGAEIVDDQYIIESIRRPRLKVVEGWETIMPAYDETQATAEEVNALVAYIRSLKKGQAADPKERFPAPVGAPTERQKPGDNPRLEPLKPRDPKAPDARPITRPPEGANAPELHPEDIRPENVVAMRKRLFELGFDAAAVDKLFPLPVAPPPRAK